MERISRADAVLAVAGPLVALSILDGFFATRLYQSSPAAFWSFDALKFIVLPGAGLYFLYAGHSIAPSHYGVVPKPKSESWGVFLGLIAFLTLFLSVTYFASYLFSRNLGTAAALTPSLVPSGFLGLPVALYLSATAGITEEILCRGLPLLYLTLRFPTRLPAGAYCFVTALLFGMAHWENGANEIVGTFVYGFLTSAFYLQVRELTPFMIAHFLGDLWWFWGRTAF